MAFVAFYLVLLSLFLCEGGSAAAAAAAAAATMVAHVTHPYAEGRQQQQQQQQRPDLSEVSRNPQREWENSRREGNHSFTDKTHVHFFHCLHLIVTQGWKFMWFLIICNHKHTSYCKLKMSPNHNSCFLFSVKTGRKLLQHNISNIRRPGNETHKGTPKMWEPSSHSLDSDSLYI